MADALIELKGQLEDLHAGMIAPLGLAQHADDNVVDRRLNQLKAQIERLAKKR